MLALYTSTMHVATLKHYLHACSYTKGSDRSMEVIWKIFLSVSAPLKKTKKNNLMFEALVGGIIFIWACRVA